MAEGTKAYLQDKDGKNLLVASDWSMVQNKPTNLATTNQLPTLGNWTTEGIGYVNGAYDWDHAHNGYNCAYRVADLGSFKIVELRMVFGVNQNITDSTKVITLPNAIRADGDEETFFATNIRGVFIRMTNGGIYVWCQHMADGDQYTANGMLSFHNMYLTTL